MFRNKTVRAVLIIALVAIFGFSTYKIVSQLSTEKEAQEHFDNLARTVRAIEASVASEVSAVSQAATEESSDEQQKPKEILPQYEPLHTQNSDFFGWLRIDDTPIDYPVMYTPRDSQYYLRRDFNGKSLVSGVPFVDGACPADGNFYLIYGHHMKNKTMFGTIPYYAEKPYWEEHSIIYFDTLYEKRTYQIMAVFYSKIYDESVTDIFKYYEYRDLTDPDVFAEYVAGVKELSVYDTGISAEYGDELIALSTCNYHTKDGRFVVVAKRCK